MIPAAAPTRDLADVVFRARGLTKTYRTGEVDVHALRDVDLDIARGEFVVLLGASGSGKSTLLNILGGLDVPTQGDVRFGEHTLSGASEAELTAYRREHVGFVFQFYNLIPSLTVRENVAYGLASLDADHGGVPLGRRPEGARRQFEQQLRLAVEADRERQHRLVAGAADHPDVERRSRRPEWRWRSRRSCRRQQA